MGALADALVRVLTAAGPIAVDTAGLALGVGAGLALAGVIGVGAFALLSWLGQLLLAAVAGLLAGLTWLLRRRAPAEPGK